MVTLTQLLKPRAGSPFGDTVGVKGLALALWLDSERRHLAVRNRHAEELETKPDETLLPLFHAHRWAQQEVWVESQALKDLFLDPVALR